MKAIIGCLIVLISGVSVSAEPLVEGWVRLDSGEPVVAAQVLLFDLTDLRSAPTSVITDETGYFALALGGALALPEQFRLGPNYPNPFNPSTLIPYQLPSSMHVRLEVFNLLGQRIATLVNGEQSAGFHMAEWEATDAAGRAVGAGVYLYRLSGDAGKISRRMVLVDGQAGSASAGSAAAARDEAGPAWETALDYGLTVSGPGLVPYVDPAFRVTAGMPPLDVVVETPSSAPRAKVASGGILGDVDNTGRVDFLDALLVALYSWDSSIVMPNSGDISLGDVNADGRVDLSDVWVIAAYLDDPTDPTLPAGIGESVGPAASLSPDPATVTLADDAAWHRFSVEAGEPVSVVVNPVGTTPRLEITTRGGLGNNCPAEAEADASREDGQTIYLSGCAAGQATVELRREADGTVLRSYTFEVTVTVGAAPDLVVDTPTVSESAPAAGAQFTLSATVRNQGRGRSSFFKRLRYYRSTDSTITTGDTELGTRVINPLEPSESEDESISLTAPSSSGTYYYGACVETASDEDDMSNNCSAALKITLVPADLVVDEPTTTYSNPNVFSYFPVDVSVRNQGNLPSGPTTLNFYRSTDSTITTADEHLRFASVSRVSRLSLNETVSLHSSLGAPSKPGTYYYGACVVSVPEESDTTNNCSPALKIVVGQVDLVVETPWISHENASGNSYIDIHAVVRNEGTGHLPDAPFFTDFTVYRSTDSTVGGGSYEAGYIWRPIDIFADSEGLTASFRAPDTAGEYYYYACVGSVVGELSEANNCSATVKLTVRPSDLTILLPTASPNILTAGEGFTLRATVLNGGDVRSANSATTIRYYRSTDATITSTDRSVGTDWLFVPRAHAISEESISLIAPSAGTYHYGACVDSVPDESDKTNNCSEAVEVTVGERPLTLRLTSCFVFENQHFVWFEVRANVPVSDVVVHTYQVEGRNNRLHLMKTTNVGNLSAGDSYEKLTTRYFPAHLRPYLTTCTAKVEWANGTDTPGFGPTTIIVPDLPRPPPTYRPPAYNPLEFRTPTRSQVWSLWIALNGTVYRYHQNCGYAGRPPCPGQDGIAWWSALPSHLQGCAFQGGCYFPQDPN